MARDTGAAPLAADRADRGPRRALVALCITEITSWGVLYYAFPVSLTAIARDTGWSSAAAMGAFSAGSVVSAAAGVPVGRLLDRHGPRWVMTIGSVLGVVAIVSVAAAPTLPWFVAAWLLTGVAQALVLYPPAFAALTRWYGQRRVRALTILSMAAGLASTVFAPLTALLLNHLDWRATFLVLAGLLGVVTIPLHARYLNVPWPAAPATSLVGRPDGRGRFGPIRPVLRSRAFVLLVAAMGLAGAGLGAAKINLVPLLISREISTATAANALAVAGLGQVLGRFCYPALARRTSPRGRIMAILVAGAVGVAALAAVRGPTALLLTLAIYVGCVRGVYTLLMATAVSDRWGTEHFGTLNGIAIAPATVAIALGPAIGALFAQVGGYPAAFYLLAGIVVVSAVLAAGTRTAARE